MKTEERRTVRGTTGSHMVCGNCRRYDYGRTLGKPRHDRLDKHLCTRMDRPRFMYEFVGCFVWEPKDDE